MLDSISILKHRGYSNAEIGGKIGCTAEWVKSVSALLEKGERRLLAAVEAGHMPLSLAIEIARSPDAECQNLLMDAYNRGDLRGKKVTACDAFSRYVLVSARRASLVRPIKAEARPISLRSFERFMRQRRRSTRLFLSAQNSQRAGFWALFRRFVICSSLKSSSRCFPTRSAIRCQNFSKN
ncbi:plasmid partitioning protein RepB C-terminal domain-containing protein [Paraburkholderia tropica]